MLLEVVEYFDNIGFRASVNRFSVCSGGGVLMSDSEQFFVQEELKLYRVEGWREEVNCETSYVDPWFAMRKFSKCLTQNKVIQDPYRLSAFEPDIQERLNCTQDEVV